MNREYGPRDTDTSGADPEAVSDLVELTETRLPTRLEVEPTSVRPSGPRRFDPRAAMIIAVAIVVAAVLATGPLATQPTPSTGPSPSPSESADVAVASNGPTPGIDPCPAGGARPPRLTVAAISQVPITSELASQVSDPDEAGFFIPTETSLEVQAGYRMRIDLNDSRCVELIGIDVVDTARPEGDPLAVRVPTPLPRSTVETVTWDAPPAGDWVVRIAILIRSLPADLAPKPWAIYYVRLNSGYVAWASPVPSDAGGGTAEGPLVTPAVACSPLPATDAPPAVSLVTGEASTLGALGAFQWRGATFEVDTATALAGATPVAITSPYQLQIAGRVCATRWSVIAETVPPLDERFGGVGLDFSPENPSLSHAVAAQNVYSFGLDVFGTYVVHAVFDFENGDSETVYWLVQQAPPTFPAAHVRSEPVGDTIELVAGCGASIQTGTRDGNELCKSGWLELVDGPVLTLEAGSSMRVGARDQSIIGWNVTYAAPAEVSLEKPFPDCPTGLTWGWSGVGLTTLEIPAMPAGDWIARVDLTLREGATTVTVPYYMRVSVTGEPLPSPGPSCSGGDY